MSGLTPAEARQIVSEARDRYPGEEVQHAVLEARAEAHGMTLEELLALGAPDDSEKRGAALAQVNRWCTLNAPGIRAIRCYLTEPPIWEIEGEYGTAKCSTAQLSEFRSAAVQIVDATRQMPELATGTDGKPIKWAKVVRSLLAAREDVEVGDVSDNGLVSGWLEDYLCARPPSDEPEEGTRYPYRKDGHVEIYGNDFREWLAQVKSERIQPKHLATMLRSAGCDPIKIKVTSETTGRASTTPGWRLP